jgi:SAM-dependent methyltransferase
MNCNICSNPLGLPVYESDRSLTSLCDVFAQTTRVRTCTHCGHVQTDELEDAAAFYDDDYAILTDSEEEDQIYEIRGDQTVYRTEHQVNVLLQKLELPERAKVLDFGCAKSSNMRKLLEIRPDIDAHLYDISDRYISFWDRFVQPDHYATYRVPEDWHGKFDAVTSFFSLEHITEPLSIVENIARLLRPGGTLYGIVPNVLTNTADFIVIDHVNHFTHSSLDHLLSRAGLAVVEIDADSHRGALVFAAQKPGGVSDDVPVSEADQPARQILQIAEFWTDAAARLRTAEATLPIDAPVAVYGAGFYGAFIRSALQHPERVRCSIDQNPFLLGTDIDGTPVVAPTELPADINDVFVGLNPAHARDIIAAIAAFSDRNLNFVYL